jgi:hypothetical protein
VEVIRFVMTAIVEGEILDNFTKRRRREGFRGRIWYPAH